MSWLSSRRGAYILSALAMILVAPWVIHDWDGFVFLRTATQLLHGVTPYQVAQDAPSYAFLSVEWPSTNSWYAYPPLALLILAPGVAVAKLFGVNDPAALRLALKLPMILGVLVLAYVAGRAAEALGGDRLCAERFVLWNPFLLFIAAAWGMFDAWMMALLLASALLLHQGRPKLAGLAFAAATLIKIFPLFVAPVFLAYVWRRDGARSARSFVLTSIAAATLVCLPFLLLSPAGFWMQTVGLHLARPMQGFTSAGLLYLPRFALDRFGVALWPVPPGWVGPAVSTLLLVGALLFLYHRALRDELSLRALLVSTLLGLLAALLFGKVVNEQYFTMPLAVLAVLVAAPGASRLERAMLQAWTWGGLVAAILIGFHFLTFFPRDVALALFGQTPEEAIFGLGQAGARVGLSAGTVFALSDVLATLAIAPAMLLSLAYVVRALARGVRVSFSGASKALTFAAVAGLVLAPAGLAAATIRLDAADAPPPMPPVPDKLVGTTYYTWWNNPGHDPDVPDGNWARLAATPEDGYTTSSGHEMELHVDAMRRAGFDFAAVAYHGYDHGRYETFSRVARAKGLYFAPMVDVDVLLGEPDLLRVSADPAAKPALRPTDATFDAVRGLAESALRLGGSDAFLRLDGKPVVFLLDPDAVQPSWDPESQRALASEVLALHDGSFANVSAAWGRPVASRDDVLRAYPEDLAGFARDDPVSKDWRAAMDARMDAFFERVRRASAEPLHLVASSRLVDPTRTGPHAPEGTFSLGPEPAYVDVGPNATREDLFASWRAQENASAAQGGSFATAFAALDSTRYRGDARASFEDPFWPAEAKRVLVPSWNGFFDGTQLTPTKEHGDAALRSIEARIAAFKAS